MLEVSLFPFWLRLRGRVCVLIKNFPLIPPKRWAGHIACQALQGGEKAEGGESYFLNSKQSLLNLHLFSIYIDSFINSLFNKYRLSVTC